MLLACVLAASTAGCVHRKPSVDVAPGLDVQGHRGCRGLRPENTMAAFQEALRLGVTTLELDLQVTRDRVVVVHHDQRLDPSRCRRDGGAPVESTAIKDLDVAELADVDCGSLPHPRFPAQRPVPGRRIPRLSEVLALALDAAYPVRLNVEIKLQKAAEGVPFEEFAGLVVGELRRFGLVDRATVQSFDAPVLAAVGRLEPALSLAMLVRDPADYERLLEASGAGILSPDFRRLRAADVARFESRGIPVIPWTVNKPRDIRRMIDWGVSGIISDYPDRVLELTR
jgi:glycerophosphoryl diester phosphodiesterase